MFRDETPNPVKVSSKFLAIKNDHVCRANIASQLPPGTEPYSVVIPLVYDLKANQTTVAQKEANPVTNAGKLCAAVADVWPLSVFKQLMRDYEKVT